jgi:hypothetical protein
MRTEQEIKEYIDETKENNEMLKESIENDKLRIIKNNAEINALEWSLQTKAEIPARPASNKKQPKKNSIINIGDSVLVLNENYETTIINKVRNEISADGFDYFYKDCLGETDSTNINNLEKL